MFSKEELKKLGSRRAINLLLKEDKPDFKKVLKEIYYQRELNQLQTKLIRLQNWVAKNDKRVIVIFEGREFSGKGGAIQALTEHLNPRSMRIVALPKPSEKERGQWYFQRYVNELPERGEILFFDRSWYNRAMVEPVNGFCTKKEYEIFMDEVNHFERMLTKDGIRIIKFYLSITKEKEKKRITAVKNNPLRRWELTSVDKNAIKLWDKYTEYKEQMFEKSDTEYAPWIIVDANDTHKGYLEIINKVLKLIPFKD